MESTECNNDDDQNKEEKHANSDKDCIEKNINDTSKPCQENQDNASIDTTSESKTSSKIVFPALRQAFVCLGIWLNMFSLGYSEGCALLMYPKLFAIHSSIPLTKESVMSIATFSALGSAPFLILVIWVMKIFGRRTAHLIVTTCMTMGFIITATAPNYTCLIFGRILQTVSKPCIVMMAITISEYSSPDLRGSFLNIKLAFFQIGISLSSAISTSVDWRTISWLGVGPSLISIIVTYYWPQSPGWLVIQGRLEELEQTFILLRGKDYVSLSELQILINRLSIESNQKPCQSNILKQTVKVLSTFGRRNFIKPFCLTISLILLMEISGRYFFVSYAVNMISEIIEDKTTQFHYLVTFQSTACVAVIVSCLIVIRFKRRTILFTTTIGAIFMSIFLSSYLLLQSRKFILPGTTTSWVPIGLMLFYYVIVNIGTSTLSSSLTGEVFPLEHRELGSLSAGIISIIFFIGVRHLSPYLIKNVNPHGMFFIYAIFMGTILTYLYIELPETYNKSLLGIEQYYIKRKKSVTTRIYA